MRAPPGRLKDRVRRRQLRRVGTLGEHVVVREQHHVLIAPGWNDRAASARAAERRADLAAATNGNVRRVVDVQKPRLGGLRLTLA